MRRDSVQAKNEDDGDETLKTLSDAELVDVFREALNDYERGSVRYEKHTSDYAVTMKVKCLHKVFSDMKE